MPKTMEVRIVADDGSEKKLRARPGHGWDAILIGEEAIGKCPKYEGGPDHKKEHKKPHRKEPKVKPRDDVPACVLKDGVWTCTSLT